jgi:hypothetical protein
MAFSQLFKIALLSVATMVTTPILAQSAENAEKPDGDDILVIGTKTIKEAVGDFIDTTVAGPKGGRNVGQYARFSAAICPKVFGFSQANDKAIEQRIRGVSLAADIRVGAEDCKPNVYVVVIDDGKSAITMLRKKHHRIFGALPIYKRDQLAESRGPVFSWKAIWTVSANGTSIHTSDGGSSLASGTSGGLSDDRFAASRTHVNSLIKQPVQEDMRASYLLLEKKALAGLTTLQIADYAAMHSLMETRADPDQDAAFFSILSLFKNKQAGRDIPDSISEWDLILLSALYSTPSDVRARMQRSAMQQKFIKEVEAAQDQ